MSQNDDLDIGPLTWVKNEIDSALSSAREKLGEVLSDPEQRAPLRFAQSHIHQAAGALSIVGLNGVSQFADGIDKLISFVSAGDDVPDVALLSLAQRSISMLGNYINEIAAGAPHQPLRLYDAYRELVAARGVEPPPPSELFFPDLALCPELGDRRAGVDQERAAHEVRALRAYFEKGLLAWLRKPQELAGPQEMLRAVRQIEQLQTLPATRSFWWAAIAFFEGLSTQAIPADRSSQRLCRRIDAQMRRLLEGSQIVAERLVRDVLYFVAAHRISTPHAQSVRQAYKLDRMLPAEGSELSDTFRQPILLRVHELLEQCKEFWNRFCAGAAVALPHFQERLGALTAPTSELKIGAVDELLASLGELLGWLRADPLRLSDDLSMEVATALLVVEQGCDSPNLNAELLRRQVELLCAQFAARVRGENPSKLDDKPFGSAARYAQERLFFNQLAREILTNLGHIEQGLDTYFRNPEQKDSLAALAGHLKQIEGAFAVTGDTQALELVRANAALVADFTGRDLPPSQDEFDAVAHQLSALGFYVEALKNGSARLDDFLNPLRAKEPAGAAAASEQTVEAQLQRETQATQQLVEALKDTPQSEVLRQQLASNLEAIRDDAQLVADSSLEQKAKEALSGLKSGVVTQEQLAETLASVAPVVAPTGPSEEAARLMSVSNEELDAELLAIFLEEAHEVLETIASNVQQVAAERHDFESLTTIRRGYHTLKGSSRMVGLQDFSEAARHVEMAMNRWLQLEKDADESLLSLINAGHALFGDWVAQLEAGGSLWRDASALVAEAEKLLASLDTPRDELENAAPITPVIPASSESIDLELDVAELGNEIPSVDSDAELQQTSSALESTQLFMPSPESGDSGEALTEPQEQDIAAELDLTSTLLGSDLFAFSSGEQADVEVDLAATDFDGDALRLFTADTEAHSFRDIQQPDNTTVDFELGDFDIDDEAVPEPEPVLGGGLASDVQTEAEAIDDELTELDLTSTAISGELDSLINGYDRIDEIDLTATDVEFDFSEIVEASPPVESDLVVELATPAQEEPAAAFVEQVVPEAVEEGVVDAGPVVLTELESLAVPVFEEPAEIEDLAEMERLEPVSEPQLVFETLEAVEEVPGENDILIGSQVLSRGLYDLYVAEARQHIEKLIGELELLRANPLRAPCLESVRAAHTLAGISGTARIDSAYGLGKALEHALHRFSDVNLPPDDKQVEIIGAAVSSLDEMLLEVVRMQMPESNPELIVALEGLHPEHGLVEHQVMLPASPEPEEELVAEFDVVAVESELVDIEEPQAVSEVADEFEPLASANVLTNIPDAPAINDELDEQLLPIFLEEAEELLASLGATLRELRGDLSDSNHLQGVARLLHTLKGSARMTGAMNLGAYVHGLESRLQDVAPEAVSSGLVDELESGLDQIGVLVEALANPPTVESEPVEVLEPLVPASAEEDGFASVAQAPVAAPRVAMPARSAPAPAPAIDELEAAQGQRAPLKVKADLVDRFVNEAGEVSIARTRIEGELRTLRRSMLDLTENVIRLRNQLREVEIQAESQMQSRIAQAESQHGNFDPLEFDRFTRLQELTRMMAESVGDVTTIQQNLLRNLDAADSALHAQGRLSRDLQQALMSVRMVPFEELTDRLYRIVRQTSKELGKRVNLDIQGGSIEIDRGVLDRMTAPIEHLLRNAIAHGVEKPELRLAAGKPEFGQVTLKLNQLSNEIALELSDDGAGLNFERIRERGCEAGLIGALEQPNENRLTQLIFEPGFSTAEAVSGISGRGIGMDVVKNETLSVGGRIDVSSTAGQGMRFIIHLPLTLAVTQALLVRSGERTYAIPSNMVEQAMEVKEQALEEIRTRGYVEWNNNQYPFAYLPRLLGDVHSRPAANRFHWILLTRAGSQTLAVHIDELRGNQEIVVKNAGPQFVRLQGFSGATVLPDGEISLILNPVALAARYVSQAAAQELSDEQGLPLNVEPVQETRIPTIMVVDDSLTVRKITSRLLEREGFQVVTAKDGVDALEQLVDIKPDVMLLDIEMPRMDGFDLARNIRADERLRDIPLIMITSRMADKHRNYAMEIGVDNYLGKPYQEEQLLELIAGFIARKR